MSDDEIVLSDLPDEDLVKQMHDDLYDGLAEEIHEGTVILLDRGWAPDRVLNEALVEGMRIVGIDFRDGILFVPEVLLAANAMKAGMEVLRPLLAETGAERMGTVVIGTVKGDIHDIGKNLVAMMLEGAGLRGGRPRHQQPRRELHRRDRGARARHPGDERAAHHDDALHEGRDRGARGEGPSRQGDRAWSAGRRSTRSSARPSAPTRTAATPRWRRRPRRRWCIAKRASRGGGLTWRAELTVHPVARHPDAGRGARRRRRVSPAGCCPTGSRRRWTRPRWWPG